MNISFIFIFFFNYQSKINLAPWKTCYLINVNINQFYTRIRWMILFWQELVFSNFKMSTLVIILSAKGSNENNLSSPLLVMLKNVRNTLSKIFITTNWTVFFNIYKYKFSLMITLLIFTSHTTDVCLFIPSYLFLHYINLVYKRLKYICYLYVQDQSWSIKVTKMSCVDSCFPSFVKIALDAKICFSSA